VSTPSQGPAESCAGPFMSAPASLSVPWPPDLLPDDLKELAGGVRGVPNLRRRWLGGRGAVAGIPSFPRMSYRQSCEIEMMIDF